MRSAFLTCALTLITASPSLGQNNCPGCKRSEVVPSGSTALPTGYSFTYTVDWDAQSQDGSCLWYEQQSRCGVSTSCNGAVTMKVTNTGGDWIDAGDPDIVYTNGQGFTISFTALTCADMRCKKIKLSLGGGSYSFCVGCSDCETAP